MRSISFEDAIRTVTVDLSLKRSKKPNLSKDLMEYETEVFNKYFIYTNDKKDFVTLKEYNDVIRKEFGKSKCNKHFLSMLRDKISEYLKGINADNYKFVFMRHIHFAGTAIKGFKIRDEYKVDITK